MGNIVSCKYLEEYNDYNSVFCNKCDGYVSKNYCQNVCDKAIFDEGEHKVDCSNWDKVATDLSKNVGCCLNCKNQICREGKWCSTCLCSVCGNNYKGYCKLAKTHVYDEKII